MQQRQFEIGGGFSEGLHDGWTTRYLGGIRYDAREFQALPGPAAGVHPAPIASSPIRGSAWKCIEDQYVSTRNLDQIGRTEDLYLGLSARLEAGFAATAFGSTRDGLILNGKLQAGADLGHEQYLIHSLGFGTRVEGDALANASLDWASRYYLRQSAHRVFFASVSGTVTSHRDPEEQLLLGGDNGLRGYPLRYQAGDASALVTLEQRFYTDWQPLKLFNVGAAVFFDAGRTWGHDRLRRCAGGLAQGRRARPAPGQRALRARQRAAHRSRVPAGSQQRHRQRAAPHRNAAVVLNSVPPLRFWWSPPACAAGGLRRAGDRLCGHAARRTRSRALCSSMQQVLTGSAPMPGS